MTGPVIAWRPASRVLTRCRGVTSALRTPPVLPPPSLWEATPDPDWDDAQYDAWMDRMVPPGMEDPLEE